MNNDLESQKAAAIQLILVFRVPANVDVINRVREITNARRPVDIEAITGRPFK